MRKARRKQEIKRANGRCGRSMAKQHPYRSRQKADGDTGCILKRKKHNSRISREEKDRGDGICVHERKKTRGENTTSLKGG